MFEENHSLICILLAVAIFFGTVSIATASSNSFCFDTDCHLGPDSSVNASLFNDSSHQYLECIDCHVNVTEYPNSTHGNFTSTLTLPLPSTSYNSSDYLLCYGCHKESSLLGMEATYSNYLWTHTTVSGYPLTVSNISTNFINELSSGHNFGNYPANIHWDHLDLHKIDAGEGPDLIWDSNRDGTLDSMISCPSCHDPHGNINGPNLTREDLGIQHGTDANGEYGEVTSIEYLRAGGDLYCAGCHGISAKYYRPTREVLDFTDLHISTTNMTSCIQSGCHYSNELTTEHIENRDLTCATCHQSSEQLVSDAIQEGDTSCLSCHTPHTSGSHTTHIDAAKGPYISCSDCHGTELPPLLADGKTLENTTACDTCHSPGGTYDGMDDLDIGARYNWAGVYNNSSGTLETGKEKWCAGCHDNESSLIQEVYAPNVAGDGIDYGYYVTGHGENEIVECSSCHDLSSLHIDGINRTYSPDSDYTTYDPESAAYQDGYRLSNVSSGYDSRYPMHIPRTGHGSPPGFREDWEFALCFECHNNTRLFDGGYVENGSDAGTNFRVNCSAGNWSSLHDLHTEGRNGPGGPTGAQYDSDFNGIGDSRMSCPSCHNVHGSRAPAMVRTGELIGKTPALNLKYLNNSPGDPLVFISQDLLNESTGAYQDVSFGTGSISSNGVCNMCHAQHVSYYRDPIEDVLDFSDLHISSTNMTSCIQSGCHYSNELTMEHIGMRGLTCATCHQDNEQRVIDAIKQGDKACFTCHVSHDTDSHSTHINAEKGPQITCSDCHSDTLPLFADEQNLNDTTVCDTCHSPGGTYDGMNDSDIGARYNWAGVYNNSSGTLEAGKEKWCAGCHDESPSVIQNVSAPNVVGNESASYTYGLGWGYYKTGHGLPSGTTFTYSGGTLSGPELNCNSCHNYSIGHIDGDSRTYNDSNDNYQQGYRLKLIDGDAPLDIPLAPGIWSDNYTIMAETQFKLCFLCHNSSKFTDKNSNTLFRNDNNSINAHSGHLGGYRDSGLQGLFWTNYWFSDWSSVGDSGYGDSRVSCPACHNVHGSTQLSMIRDGKLIDKEPAMPILYYNDDVVFGGYWDTPNPDNITLDNSTGTMWVGRDLGQICSNCHGGGWNKPPNLYSPYLRTP